MTHMEYVGNILGWIVDGEFTCFRCIGKQPKRQGEMRPPEDCVVCKGRGGVVPLVKPMRRVDDRLTG